jgi:hypothetical protein
VFQQAGVAADREVTGTLIVIGRFCSAQRAR